MTDLAFDSLDRSRLDWPEPLLIDLVSACYRSAASLGDRVVAARLHVRFLHELVDGDQREAGLMRLELQAFCAARNISLEDIEQADSSAFRELASIVELRFRHSTRMRTHFLQRLDEAVDRLPERAASSSKSAVIRTLVTGRAAQNRAPLRFMPRAAAG